MQTKNECVGDGKGKGDLFYKLPVFWMITVFLWSLKAASFYIFFLSVLKLMIFLFFVKLN